MTRISTSKARETFSDVIGQVVYAGERVVLERRGKPVAAVISIEDLRLLEALEDRADARAVRRGMREGGKPVPWSKVKKDLGLSG